MSEDNIEETNINDDVSGSELEDFKKERDEYLNGWQRAKADFINYKKDEANRFELMMKYSNEGLIKDLIVVMDSFDLAIASLEKGNTGGCEKGIYLIRTQLEDLLKNYGLEKMAVLEGQLFDPAMHDAVALVESDNHPSGMIVEEVERGYFLNGKLIRPARVKVAK